MPSTLVGALRNIEIGLKLYTIVIFAMVSAQSFSHMHWTENIRVQVEIGAGSTSSRQQTLVGIHVQASCGVIM